MIMIESPLKLSGYMEYYKEPHCGAVRVGGEHDVQHDMAALL